MSEKLNLLIFLVFILSLTLPALAAEPGFGPTARRAKPLRAAGTSGRSGSGGREAVPHRRAPRAARRKPRSKRSTWRRLCSTWHPCRFGCFVLRGAGRGRGTP